MSIKQIKLGLDADHSGGFPYVRIFLLGIDNPLADNLPSYERVYRYAVEIWQEISAKSKSDAEIDFENAIHAVMNRLSGTWQLGINVENSKIEAGQISTVQDNSGPMRVARLVLAVTTLIQNPS